MRVAAPIATSSVQRGVKFSFGRAPRHGVHEEGMRVTGEQFWCTVGPVASGASTVLQTQAGSQLATLAFDPNDNLLMPQPLTNFGQSFWRYILRRCRVTYVPSTPTNSNVAIAFCATTDVARLSASILNFGQVQQQTNSIAGPAWQGMSLDIPCDEEMRYITDSVASGVITTAESRQNHAFFLTAYADQVSTGQVAYGNLRIQYVVDFYEVGSTTPEGTLLRKLAALRRCDPKSLTVHIEEKREGKEEPVEDYVLAGITPVAALSSGDKRSISEMGSVADGCKAVRSGGPTVLRTKG